MCNPLSLLFGKTKVMAKSLGSTEADEYAPNLSQLSTYLTGSVGLLFTNQTPEKIVEYFSSFSRTDFARAGVESPRTFILPAGILHSRGGEIDETDDVPLPHSIEPNLRALGVPTRLMKGKVELENDYEICKEGDVLDSRQTRLLKMFGVAVAEFSVELLA
jgi:mRNA turnover protein 4